MNYYFCRLDVLLDEIARTVMGTDSFPEGQQQETASTVFGQDTTDSPLAEAGNELCRGEAQGSVGVDPTPGPSSTCNNSIGSSEHSTNDDGIVDNTPSSLYQGSVGVDPTPGPSSTCNNRSIGSSEHSTNDDGIVDNTPNSLYQESIEIPMSGLSSTHNNRSIGSSEHSTNDDRIVTNTPNSLCQGSVEDPASGPSSTCNIRSIGSSEHSTNDDGIVNNTPNSLCQGSVGVDPMSGPSSTHNNRSIGSGEHSTNRERIVDNIPNSLYQGSVEYPTSGPFNTSKGRNLGNIEQPSNFDGIVDNIPSSLCLTTGLPAVVETATTANIERSDRTGTNNCSHEEGENSRSACLPTIDVGDIVELENTGVRNEYELTASSSSIKNSGSNISRTLEITNVMHMESPNDENGSSCSGAEIRNEDSSILTTINAVDIREWDNAGKLNKSAETFISCSGADIINGSDGSSVLKTSYTGVTETEAMQVTSRSAEIEATEFGKRRKNSTDLVDTSDRDGSKNEDTEVSHRKESQSTNAIPSSNESFDPILSNVLDDIVGNIHIANNSETDGETAKGTNTQTVSEALCSLEGELFRPESAEREHFLISAEREHSPKSAEREHFLKSAEREHFQKSAEIEHFPKSAEKEHFPKSAEKEHSPKSDEKEHFQKSAEKEHFQKSAEIEHFPKSAEKEHFPKSAEKEHSPKSDEKEHFQKSAEKEHFQKSAEIEHFQKSDEKEHFQKSAEREHSPKSAEREHSPKSAERAHFPESSEIEAAKVKSTTDEARMRGIDVNIVKDSIESSVNCGRNQSTQEENVPIETSSSVPLCTGENDLDSSANSANNSLNSSGGAESLPGASSDEGTILYTLPGHQSSPQHDNPNDSLNTDDGQEMGDTSIGGPESLPQQSNVVVSDRSETLGSEYLDKIASPKTSIKDPEMFAKSDGMVSEKQETLVTEHFDKSPRPVLRRKSIKDQGYSPQCDVLLSDRSETLGTKHLDKFTSPVLPRRSIKDPGLSPQCSMLVSNKQETFITEHLDKNISPVLPNKESKIEEDIPLMKATPIISNESIAYLNPGIKQEPEKRALIRRSEKGIDHLFKELLDESRSSSSEMSPEHAFSLSGSDVDRERGFMSPCRDITKESDREGIIKRKATASPRVPFDFRSKIARLGKKVCAKFHKLENKVCVDDREFKTPAASDAEDGEKMTLVLSDAFSLANVKNQSDICTLVSELCSEKPGQSTGDEDIDNGHLVAENSTTGSSIRHSSQEDTSSSAATDVEEDQVILDIKHKDVSGQSVGEGTHTMVEGDSMVPERSSKSSRVRFSVCDRPCNQDLVNSKPSKLSSEKDYDVREDVPTSNSCAPETGLHPATQKEFDEENQNVPGGSHSMEDINQGDTWLSKSDVSNESGPKATSEGQCLRDHPDTSVNKLEDQRHSHVCSPLKPLQTPHSREFEIDLTLDDDEDDAEDEIEELDSINSDPQSSTPPWRNVWKRRESCMDLHEDDNWGLAHHSTPESVTPKQSPSSSEVTDPRDRKSELLWSPRLQDMAGPKFQWTATCELGEEYDSDADLMMAVSDAPSIGKEAEKIRPSVKRGKKKPKARGNYRGYARKMNCSKGAQGVEKSNPKVSVTDQEHRNVIEKYSVVLNENPLNILATVASLLSMKQPLDAQGLGCSDSDNGASPDKFPERCIDTDTVGYSSDSNYPRIPCDKVGQTCDNVYSAASTSSLTSPRNENLYGDNSPDFSQDQLGSFTAHLNESFKPCSDGDVPSRGLAHVPAVDSARPYNQRCSDGDCSSHTPRLPGTNTEHCEVYSSRYYCDHREVTHMDTSEREDEDEDCVIVEETSFSALPLSAAVVRKTDAEYDEDVRKTEAEFDEDVRKTDAECDEDVRKVDAESDEDVRKADAEYDEDDTKQEPPNLPLSDPKMDVWSPRSPQEQPLSEPCQAKEDQCPEDESGQAVSRYPQVQLDIPELHTCGRLKDPDSELHQTVRNSDKNCEIMEKLDKDCGSVASSDCNPYRNLRNPDKDSNCEYYPAETHFESSSRKLEQDDQQSEIHESPSACFDDMYFLEDSTAGRDTTKGMARSSPRIVKNEKFPLTCVQDKERTHPDSISQLNDLP